jgi:hypothetical protein
VAGVSSTPTAPRSFVSATISTIEAAVMSLTGH